MDRVQREHFIRHCEEPTGRANARPMTGSATKQSSFLVAAKQAGLLRFARNDGPDTFQRGAKSFKTPE
jgi:hypothetical protein